MREAREGRSRRRHDRGDDRPGPEDAGREQARRAPWPRERRSHDVRRDN
jgi:hypothetical protein